jgi:hypothetical protein
VRDRLIQEKLIQRNEWRQKKEEWRQKRKEIKKNKQMHSQQKKYLIGKESSWYRKAKIWVLY